MGKGMKKRKQIEIANTCIEAISDSQKIYAKMSGGEWLLHAPEYFLTTMIALGINAKVRKTNITLENSTFEALEEAEATDPKKLVKKQLHKDIRANGRVDILIWNTRGWPIGAIEVKNNCWENDKIKSDLKRINRILKLNYKNSSLKFGIFTYYYSLFKGSNKNSKNKLKSKEKQ